MSNPPSQPANAILERWQQGSHIADNNFETCIRKTFDLPEDDDYVYKTEGFQMTLGQIQEKIDSATKYVYQVHDKPVDLPDSDITAYIDIFSSTTDTTKALNSFKSNAKKLSPREGVAQHLLSRRLFPSSLKSSKVKKPHPNPYFDIWAWSCYETRFIGPLGDPHYGDPDAAKKAHPVLPVFYHHFGCVCPSYEALGVVSQLVAAGGKDGVVDMASGNGYWSYMLRRLGVKTTAVDNLASTWRTMWIEDTVKMNGIDYLTQQRGAKSQVLLLVYMVVRFNFTKQVLRAYKGDTIVIAGTQNGNRLTTFADCTVEEYFEQEMKSFQLVARFALPSFAGKDEALYVYQRKK